MFSDNDHNNAARPTLAAIWRQAAGGHSAEPVNPAMISYNYEVYDRIMRKRR